MPTAALTRRPPPLKNKRHWDANNVKALRTYLGMTQQMFANELGVRQQTVSEWEKGIYRPRGATITLFNLIAKQHGFKHPDDK
jgi:DNA-binding transcriptional regulator YiaG